MNYIGIDLGGTSVKGGLIDESGHIIKKHSVPTENNRERVLESICEMIELIDDGNVECVGIGSPGQIDSLNGKVADIGGNISEWANTDVVSYVSDRHKNKRIYIDNDANLAALCEAWVGAGEPYDYFIMLTLGTGLGGALIYKKDVFNGGNFKAGEFGHSILYPNGRLCSCGQKGCVETYVSGTGIEKSYYELTAVSLTGYEIMNTVYSSSYSRNVVNRFCDDLSTYLVSLKNIFAPQCIVLGGGLINASPIWWDRMISLYENKANVSNDMKILPAMHFNDSGILGAAYLAMKRSD